MRERESERKREREKEQKRERESLGTDAAHQFLKKASIASRNVDEGVPDV